MKKSIGAETIIYPTPVLVVGTYDAEGKPNVMTVAWGGICCSSPPCVTIALRKATYAYSNIVQQGAFTINIPSEKHARCADYFGIVSGKKTDKFECKLLHKIEIGLHTQFIGEILDIKTEEGVLDEKGMLDIEKVRPFFYAPGANVYYRMGEFLGKAFSIGQGVKKKQ